MNVTLRTQGVELSEELRKKLDRKLMFALDRHQHWLVEVDVFLADVNGPRGGVDKLCQITATGRGSERVRILEKSSNVIAGVNRAAQRLSYRIAKLTKKRRGTAQASSAMMRSQLSIFSMRSQGV
jgi:ribosome-associated translation inhibitor RaiA